MAPVMRQAIHLKVKTLYISHLSWLQGWLHWKVGSRETAEDLSQDVFMRLLGRPDVVGIQRPRAYLGKIARGLVIDHWRRKDVEKAWLDIQAALPEPSQSSPEQRLEIVEAIVAVDRILETLSLRRRRAFLMARVQGMTCSAIARHLGVSLATVERDIAEALRQCYRAAFKEPS